MYTDTNHPTCLNSNIQRVLGTFHIFVLSFIAMVLLLSPLEKLLFGFIQSIVCILSPCLQWQLQRHKRFITGPWDIAHIHVPS